MSFLYTNAGRLCLKPYVEECENSPAKLAKHRLLMIVVEFNFQIQQKFWKMVIFLPKKILFIHNLISRLT